jgi:hypothetical protein
METARNCYNIIWQKSWNWRDELDDLRVYEKVILKWISKKQGERLKTWLRLWGFTVLRAVVIKIFCDITLCSTLKINMSSVLATPTCFILVCWLVYSSDLKMEATFCSETPFNFQRAARRYIKESRTIQMIKLSPLILWRDHTNVTFCLVFRLS